MLSVKAGLRAKEIASLTWRMVTDAGRPGHPDEQGAQDRLRRVFQDGLDARQALLDREREVEGDVTASRGQLVLALVPARRLRWLLQSLRASQFHHQCSAEGIHRGRIAAGRPAAGRAFQPSNHPGLHRGERGGAGPDRGSGLAVTLDEFYSVKT